MSQNSLEHLLAKNKAWAQRIKDDDPSFFQQLSSQQKPRYLWIGCADSRVPCTQLVDLLPGDMFVHRNVANLVIHTDFNRLSVMQYAIDVLQVEHIIVCGHHGCGGVRAAMTNHDMGIANKWLRNIKDVYRYHRDEVDKINDEELKIDKMVELNVKEQVMNLAKTSIIQRSWKYENRPQLHGWVYDLKDGIIDPICEMPAGSMLLDIYQYDDL